MTLLFLRMREKAGWFLGDGWEGVAFTVAALCTLGEVLDVCPSASSFPETLR